MSRIIACLTALTFSMWWMPSALFAELKPVLVISTSPLEEILADVKQAELIIRDGPKPSDEFRSYYKQLTGSDSIEGVDLKRPLGAVFLLEPRDAKAKFDLFPYDVQFLAFAPIADWAAFKRSLRGLDLIEKDKVLTINSREISGAPIYVKHESHWAFFTSHESLLDETPKDPMALLEDLPERYDLAARLNLLNVPDALHAMANSFADELANGSDDQKRSAKLLRLVEQTRDVTVGFSYQRAKRDYVADTVIRPMADTELQRRTAKLAASPPGRFHGFSSPNAPLTMHCVPSLDDDLFMQWALTNFNDEHTGWLAEGDPALMHVVASFFGASWEKRQTDFAVALQGKDSFSWIAGTQTRSAAATISSIQAAMLDWRERKLVADISRVEDPKPLGDVVFRAYDVDLHGDAASQSVAKFFGGDPIRVVIGAHGADNLVYLAVGNNGSPNLRDAIERSAVAPELDLADAEVQLHMAPLVRFVGSLEPDDAELAKLVGSFGDASGKTKMSIRFLDEGGYHLRPLEVNESVLRAAIDGAEFPWERIPIFATLDRSDSPDDSPVPERDRKATANKEAMANSYLKFGEKFQSQGRMQLAEKWYAKAAQIAPESPAGKAARQRLNKFKR